jgi:hypothetical protein
VSPRASSVFLNVPFDEHYQPYFLALIASIVAVGRTPRCVLELPEKGAGRLSRLLERISACDVSIHDLSRVGLPARFNMPFELGLACAARAFGARHSYVLLERQPYRLDRTLSDIKGRDPYVYGRSPRRLISCVLDALRRSSGPALDVADVHLLSKALASLSRGIMARHASRTLFTRSIFLAIVTDATVLAAQRGWIPFGRGAHGAA